MANEYSPAWFDAFAEPTDAYTTVNEVAALVHWIPLPGFRQILDVCCAMGRHAEQLVQMGYDVTGVDRDSSAVAAAAQRVPEARFVQSDQRTLEGVDGVFDAVLVLWQSFGYFDSAGNDAVLAVLSSKLLPGGRLLLDVYHPLFWLDHQGVRLQPRPGVRSIDDSVVSDRLLSRILYEDGSVDEMSFELLDPRDLVRRAHNVDLALVDQCCWWDRRRSPEATEARYQSVFQKAAVAD